MERNSITKAPLHNHFARKQPRETTMPLKFHKAIALKTLYLPFYGLLGWVLYGFVPMVLAENTTIEQSSYIIIWLLLLSTLLVNLAFELKLQNKIKIKDYEHINPPGFYKHKNDGEYYCKRCLIKDKNASPLNPIAIDVFCCRICDQKYNIDYNVMINDSYLSIVLENDPLWKRHDKAVKEIILKDKI